MKHSQNSASSHNQSADQWTQGANGIWLPKRFPKAAIMPPSKRGKQQQILWTQRQIAGKTLWDWVSLLLIPILIGIGTILVTNRQTDAQNALSTQLHQADQEVAQQSRWDDLLAQYRDGIDALLLNNGLRHASPNNDVSDIAHARTIDILNAVDASRRRSVISYLGNLHLIQGGFFDNRGIWHQQQIHISLARANLAGTDLSDVNLAGADLEQANLAGADLYIAGLAKADLTGADLTRAFLLRTFLSGANLTLADLSEANLASANIYKADFIGVRLNKVGQFEELSITITSQQLKSSFSLSGTTLPNGQICRSIPITRHYGEFWTTRIAQIEADNRDACLRKAGYL